MEDAGLTQWGVKEREIPGIPAQTVTNQCTSPFKYTRTVGLLVEGVTRAQSSRFPEHDERHTQNHHDWCLPHAHHHRPSTPITASFAWNQNRDADNTFM